MSDKKPDASRRSRRWAFIWMFLALISGLGATALVGRYLNSRSSSAMEMKTTQIVVASRDIPMAATMTMDHLKLVEFPQNAAPKGAFLKVEDAVGRVPRNAFVPDEPILEARLAPKSAGTGFAALIPANLRAMAVKVNEVIGVAGLIHPNDWVDVITVITMEGRRETYSKVILQKVKVFAVGEAVESPSSKKDRAQPVTVVTLLVTPEQSESLALAAAEGRIQLALRGQLDEEEVLTAGIDPRTLIQGTEQPKMPAEKSKTRAIARKDKSKADPLPATTQGDGVEVVEVFHGRKLEERKIRTASGSSE